ncbi:MAG: DUF481 domain-containing protein [Gammaproteobacteria bacterium]|nr:DUF481 domain-containing protein [Gammaproteobacteria bacterium]
MNTIFGTPNRLARVVPGVLALLICTSVLARDKTDVIYMANGDRLTGEIKQLERGMLVVSTDSMGEVRIEWKDISRIQSSYEFQFERSDGTRVTSTIQDTPDVGEISLVDNEVIVAFRRENIVRISQIEDSFWDRLKGSLSFGYSFTKASDIAQLNLGFRATHRTEIRSLTLDGSTITTSDSSNEATNRSDLSFAMTRFRKNRWFNSYLLGLESNDELGLNLRTSAGAGLGRYIIQTNNSELSVIGGLIGTSEQLTGETSSEQNLEGLLGMEYSRYVFDEPTVDLTTSLATFPSITDAGRLRAQFDISLKWEIIKDLYWDLSYYNTYDSDPPSGSLSTTDYGIVTSIGWSF